MAAPESPQEFLQSQNYTHPQPPINTAALVQRWEVSACSDQMEAGYGGNELEPGDLTALLQADGL